MEASTTGAPPAAADAGQVEAPAQTEAPAADLGQPTPEPAEEQALDPSSPEARLKAAEDRVKELEGAQSEQPAESQPTDLLSALEGEDDLGLSPEDIAAYTQGEDPGEMQADDPRIKEFEDWIDQRVQDRLSPIEEAQKGREIQAWHKEHPDVKPGTPIWNELLATMQKLGGQFGENATKDVGLLDLAYTAAKAKQADAGATPATQAASNGASLETQAGQSQTGETTPEQLYKEKVFGEADSRGGSGFVS